MTTVKTTRSVLTGLTRIDQLADGDNTIHSMIELYEEESDGRKKLGGSSAKKRIISWVVIPDHMWERATTTDYIKGIPMLQKRS